MTALEFIDKRSASEASKRTRRQLLAVKRWVQSGCKASVDWPTGVGKTRIATEAISTLRREDSSRTVVVVVPTLQLQQQWEKGLEKSGLLENTQVFVINSLVKRRIDCELLVLDEIHRYAAKTFFKVFECVNYDFVLGLTATIKRIDKKHYLLEEKAPVIDKMTIFEAKRESFIAEYSTYNLAVQMTGEEREKYRDMIERYNYNMDKFHRDFDLMMRCGMGIEPVERPDDHGGVYYLAPQVVKYAWNLGWKGHTPREAWNNMVWNKQRARGEQKKEVWGNTEHPYSPDRLYVCAIQGMKAIRDIKTFVHTHPGKRQAVIDVLNAFDLNTIVFAETIESVQQIHDALPESTVMYHSKMVKKEREKSLEEVFSGRKRTILTARALDQGTDWPEAELGVIVDRNSSTIQNTQRTGRVVRLHTFEDGEVKKSMMVNIYLADTKDYDWMSKGQKGGLPPKWVDSVDQILEAEGQQKR